MLFHKQNNPQVLDGVLDVCGLRNNMLKYNGINIQVLLKER